MNRACGICLEAPAGRICPHIALCDKCRWKLRRANNHHYRCKACGASALELANQFKNFTGKEPTTRL